jgi:hypothetical protein
MKKNLLALIICLVFTRLVKLEAWEGIIIHKDFSCYYLGDEKNPAVIAAKGIDAMGNEWVHVKIKSPINLGNTGTAWARIDGTSTALNYHNGWIYMEFLNANYKYITVYPDMYMREGGKTVMLDLLNLNMSEMYVNNHKAFDLYW